MDILFEVLAVKKTVNNPMNNLWRKKIQTFFIDIHRFIHRVIHRILRVIHRVLFDIILKRSNVILFENIGLP